MRITSTVDGTLFIRVGCGKVFKCFWNSEGTAEYEDMRRILRKARNHEAHCKKCRERGEGDESRIYFFLGGKKYGICRIWHMLGMW